jgi:hypothetical protein
MRRAMPDMPGKADSSEKKQTGSHVFSPQPKLHLLLCNIEGPAESINRSVEKRQRDPHRFHLVKSLQSDQIAAVQPKSGRRASSEKRWMPTITIGGSTWVDTPFQAPLCFALQVF